MLKTVRNKNKGQSLVELIIAMAVFAVLAVSLASFFLSLISSAERSAKLLAAGLLLQESSEALKSLAGDRWSEFIYARSAVSSDSEWSFSGEGTTEQLGQFTKIIDFLPVYRSVNSHELAASGSAGTYLDVLSRRADISVLWTNENNLPAILNDSFYISAWNASVWEQTDWSGGSGQTIWELENKYESDDSNIYSLDPGEVRIDFVSSTTLSESASLYSSAYYAGGARAFIAIAWSQDIPDGCGACSVKFQIKTAPDLSGQPGIWSSFWSGPEGKDGDESDYFSIPTGELIHIDHTGEQWIKYKAVLSGDGTNTPVLSGIKIYYQ